LAVTVAHGTHTHIASQTKCTHCVLLLMKVLQKHDGLLWLVVLVLPTPADFVRLDVRQHWRLRKAPYSLPCNPQGSTPCSTRAPESTVVREEQP
jgi:hypothetical protein